MRTFQEIEREEILEWTRHEVGEALVGFLEYEIRKIQSYTLRNPETLQRDYFMGQGSCEALELVISILKKGEIDE